MMRNLEGGSVQKFLRRTIAGIVLSATAFIAIALTPSESWAIRIVVTELSRCPFNPIEGHEICFGEEISIGIRVEADSGENVYGLGLSAYDYNESVVDFVRGSAVPSIFHGVAIPGVGAFNGLSSVITGPLSESSLGARGNRVQLFNGIGLTPLNYNPLDPGLDGVIGGGGTQFRVVFSVMGAGTSLLRIGTGYPDDGVVYAGNRRDQSAGIVIFISSEESPRIIPEPNSMLFLGFGLAMLATRRYPRSPGE